MAAPRKAVYIFLFHKDELFAVKNKDGELGVPGGKMEPSDATWEDALKREFIEETGQEIGDEYIKDFFEYYNHSGNITVRNYYTNLDDVQAGKFKSQKVDDPACDEVEVLWSVWRFNPQQFRQHTKQDLTKYKVDVLGETRGYTDPVRGFFKFQEAPYITVEQLDRMLLDYKIPLFPNNVNNYSVHDSSASASASVSAADGCDDGADGEGSDSSSSTFLGTDKK